MLIILINSPESKPGLWVVAGLLTKLRNTLCWMAAKGVISPAMHKVALTILLLMLAGCGDDPVIAAGECHNALSPDEVTEGWQLLFDGESLSHWRSYADAEVNPGWGIENGCLTRLDSAGDLITRERFADFELKLEWRISDSGNSGIFIRADESGDRIFETGMEMQVLDNAGHWDRFFPSHRAGAFYDMIVPDHDTSQPVGYWNRVHIIARGPHLQFWLNERLTAEFEQGSDQWQVMYEDSKFSDRPRWGTLLEGHIGLQDHWDKVWFRNIRVLRL